MPIVTSLVLLLALSPAAAALDGPELLKNPSFTSWKEGAPEHWTISTGAKNRNGPESSVAPITTAGLALSGTDATGVWKLVSQTVKAPKPGLYRLVWEGRAKDQVLAKGQFSNSFIELKMIDARGTPRRDVRPIRHKDWRRGVLRLMVPEGCQSLECRVFMSLTGRLELRRTSLKRLKPEEAFDDFLREFDRLYSLFPFRGKGWDEAVAKHGPAVRAAGKDLKAFYQAMLSLLGTLEDPHISLGASGRRLSSTCRKKVASNFHAGTVFQALKDAKRVGRRNIYGGLGIRRIPYVHIGTLMLDPEKAGKLRQALLDQAEAPVQIIDLRSNIGGSEPLGLSFARLFAEDKPVIYARSKQRVGDARDAYIEGPPRRIAPAGVARCKGRALVLIGPATVSSAESLAMMFKALPRARLIGLPTRGASGNPQPLPLANGLTVSFSRWVNLTPDGTPIETRGVQPDRVVAHKVSKEGGDPAFEAALEEAKAILGKAPAQPAGPPAPEGK